MYFVILSDLSHNRMALTETQTLTEPPDPQIFVDGKE